MKPQTKDTKMVYVDCGHEVSKCDNCLQTALYKAHGLKLPHYFCGNCNRHHKAVKVETWQKARKLLGLSTKINDWRV